VNKRKMDVLH